MHLCACPYTHSLSLLLHACCKHVLRICIHHETIHAVCLLDAHRVPKMFMQVWSVWPREQEIPTAEEIKLLILLGQTTLCHLPRDLFRWAVTYCRSGMFIAILQTLTANPWMKSSVSELLLASQLSLGLVRIAYTWACYPSPWWTASPELW